MSSQPEKNSYIKIFNNYVEEAAALQLTEQIFASVERSQLKIVPKMYDIGIMQNSIENFYKALQNDLPEEKLRVCERRVRAETESWRGNLIRRDEKIAPYHLRRFCEELGAKPDRRFFEALAGFYYAAAHHTASQSKFDFVLTKIFTNESHENRQKLRNLTIEKNDLEKSVAELFQNWTKPAPQTDSRTYEAVEKLGELTDEAQIYATLEELIQSSLFTRIRQYKTDIRDIFFTPAVASAAIFCNMTVGNRFSDLIAAENAHISEYVNESTNLFPDISILDDASFNEKPLNIDAEEVNFSTETFAAEVEDEEAEVEVKKAEVENEEAEAVAEKAEVEEAAEVKIYTDNAEKGDGEDEVELSENTDADAFISNEPTQNEEAEINEPAEVRENFNLQNEVQSATTETEESSENDLTELENFIYQNENSQETFLKKALESESANHLDDSTAEIFNESDNFQTDNFKTSDNTFIEIENSAVGNFAETKDFESPEANFEESNYSLLDRENLSESNENLSESDNFTFAGESTFETDNFSLDNGSSSAADSSPYEEEIGNEPNDSALPNENFSASDNFAFDSENQNGSDIYVLENEDVNDIKTLDFHDENYAESNNSTFDKEDLTGNESFTPVETQNELFENEQFSEIPQSNENDPADLLAVEDFAPSAAEIKIPDWEAAVSGVLRGLAEDSPRLAAENYIAEQNSADLNKIDLEIFLPSDEENLTDEEKYLRRSSLGLLLSANAFAEAHETHENPLDETQKLKAEEFLDEIQNFNDKLRQLSRSVEGENKRERVKPLLFAANMLLETRLKISRLKARAAKAKQDEEELSEILSELDEAQKKDLREKNQPRILVRDKAKKPFAPFLNRKGNAPNIYLIAATILVVLISGALYLHTANLPDENTLGSSKNTVIIEPNSLSGGEYIDKARVNNQQFVGYVKDNWKAASDQRRKEVLQDLMNDGVSRGFNQIVMISNKGAVVSSADQQGVYPNN